MVVDKSKVRSLLSSFCQSCDVEVDEIILDYWQDILVSSSFLESSTSSIDSEAAVNNEDLSPEGVFEMISPQLLDLCRTGSSVDEDEVMRLAEKIHRIIVPSSGTEVSAEKKKSQQTSFTLGALQSRSNRSSLHNLLNKGEKTGVKPAISLEHHFTGKLSSSGGNQPSSLVDEEKLAKAEAKLKLKMEKRLQKEGKALPSSGGGETEIDEVDWMAWLMDNVSSATGNSATENSRDIKIEDFDIGYAGKPILTNATLTLAYGRRYGLVGRNGEGKSTLLRAISTRQVPVSRSIRILHVEQEVVGDETTALDSVMKADSARNFLIAKEKELIEKLQNFAGDIKASTWQNQLKMVYKKLEEIEADKLESRASSILNGLGFSTIMQQRATKTFSGGWRMRLSLARALLTQPDLLLLDEPTNMLDVPAVAWLERYLTTTWRNTLLVVSHDRNFLTGVTTDILHLHHGVLDSYKGDYEVFVATKDERLKHQQKEYENQLQYRQHLQSFIDRWRYNAKRATQAQSKMKILEKLPDLKPVMVDAPVRFKFPDCERLAPPLLQMSEVWFSYNATDENPNWLIKGIHFDLTMESRMAIVGANGCGKTTFLKTMIGQLNPQKGYIFRHNRLKFAYFSQFFIDQLDLSANAFEYLLRLFPGYPPEYIRAQLGSMGLSGSLAVQLMRTLSGGQKSRVAFTMLCLQNPHILILDEPTNHLDMDSIDALADALERFNGGVIVVSHDEQFMNRVCREIYECRDGEIKRFEGTIKDYKKMVLSSPVTNNLV